MQTEAVRARNESQRNQPPSDSARRNQNVPAGQGLPVRTQSDGDGHPEPPWISLTLKRSLVQIQYGHDIFEIVSSGESRNESQPPAVLSLRCWSERLRLRPHRRLSRAWHPYWWISRPAVAVTGTRLVSRRARGLYACHRAGYSLVYGPAGPARRERRSDTPARGIPSQACPGTTTDRKLVPPQVHRSVPPKPGTPVLSTHPAGMRALPGGRTGNSAAGDLATQRSGNDEAGHRLSPVGDGGRGLGP